MADGNRVPDVGAISSATHFLGVDGVGTTGIFARAALATQLSDDLYINADSRSANLVGATDAADPGGRETYAPALVASLQARRLYGVSNRDLLGRNYNPVNDASVALNGFLGELAADGIALNDPDNLVATLETGLIVPAYMKMVLGPNSRFRRAFEGS